MTMNRRHALLSCALFLPFFQKFETGWTSFVSTYTISFNHTSGLLTIISKTRTIKIQIEDIMNALEDNK